MLTISNIKKDYGLGEVLTDFSMVVHSGEKVGLIGANGSGKSTICKIISGLEKPDGGTIALGKKVRVGYLEQIPERVSGETLEERLWRGVSHLLELQKRMQQLEILMNEHRQETQLVETYIQEYTKCVTSFEAQGGYSFESKIKRIVQGLGLTVPLSSKVADLSGGELARLQLAALLLVEPEIILLDEPTNHLDFSAIIWLEKYIEQYQGTVIIISHDRYFLDKTIARVVEIQHGRAEEYPGNYSAYLKEREVRYQIALKNFDNQQKEIKRKQEAIKRLRQWASAADNEMLFKRAKAMEKQLAKMDKLVKPTSADCAFQFKFGAERSGKEVVFFENVSKGFLEKPLFTSLDFKLFYGQRVGLVGPNGSGKSTILKLITNELEPDQGQIKLGSNLRLGYFDQHQEISNLDQSLLTAFRLDAPVMSETSARNILAYYGFRGDQVFKLVKELSGGERSRFMLLKMVYSQTNFLILDEPTNHLDLPSIEILEEALVDYQGTLLVVSHDRYFLNQVCQEIYALEAQSLVYYRGNYDYYLQQIAKQKPKQVSSTTKKLKREKDKNPEQRPKKRLEKTLLDVEAEIAELETKLSLNDQLLIKPEFLHDYQYLSQLEKENVALKAKMEQLWQKWEQVGLQLEELNSAN